ncbi:MAG: DUF4417 domain-containing protein [Coriobacteriia bacterium]|nr:DUF4417 domain-containing protein [Coriobacteriia bacterium]
MSTRKGRPTHARDVFHAFLIEGASFSEEWEMPRLAPVPNGILPPSELVAFSRAQEEKLPGAGRTVHFFEDDFRFERIWNEPKKYLARLLEFDSIIMPDFSTCIDFPKPLKMWEAYRNLSLASWLQRQGAIVYPNARHQPGCDWLIESLPRQSVIAVCGRCLIQNVEERRRFVRDLRTTIDMLEPSGIVYYGSDSHNVLDYPRALGIKLWTYPADRKGGLREDSDGNR